MSLMGQVATFPPVVEMVGGRATFPCVGLGAELIVRASAPSLGATWRWAAPGPARSGTESVVTFHPEVDPSQPWITGHVLASDGVALESAPLRVSVLDMQRVELVRIRAKTDALGNFRVQLPRPLDVGRRLRVWLLRGGEGTWEGRARATMTLSEGDNPLGELTLEDTISELRGTCVDFEGQPIAGVGIVVAKDYADVVASTKTWQDGTFELHGLFPAQAAVRIISDVWVLREPVALTPGAEPEALTLVRGGHVTGSLLLAGGVDPGAFRVTAVREGGAPLRFFGPEALAAVNPKTGAFVLPGLASGAYTCRGFRRGDLVYEVTGIAVEPPERAQLGRIDLVDNFSPIHLTVIDSEGQSIQGLESTLLDGTRVVDRMHSEAGVVSLIATRDILDPVLTLRAKGFEPLVIRPGGGHDLRAPIELAAGIDINLELSQTPKIEQGEFHVEAYLEWLDAPEPLDIAVRLPTSLLTSGAGSLSLPGPGVYRLALVVRRPRGETPRTPFGTGDFQITVVPEDQGTRLHLTMPASLVD
jgi:hypothetical protein